MLDWWLKQMTFSQEDMKKLSSSRDMSLFPTTISYDELDREYRNILGYGEDFHISFSENASNIIMELFRRHVDNDTLVITTKSEHPSVVENLEKCKNVLKITRDFRFNNFVDIEKSLRKFKKIFVYTIGLSMGNDYRTPDFLHQYLRRYAKGKDVICVLDAVQEMFLLPRDYSEYDYVIGTAHALIPNFNMGIVVSRETFDKDIQNGYDFLKMVQMLLTKKEYIYLFNYVMSEHFSRFMMTDDNLSKTSNCPYIFTLKDNMRRIEGIQEITGERPSESIVTFRACNDFINLEKFRRKLSLVENSLG